MPILGGLCLQDNQLCTLKGSLSRFKFLETLDLSGNKLCNLAKLLETLGKFQFLQMLNLVVRLPASRAPQSLMSISQAAEDAGQVSVPANAEPCDVATVPDVLLQLPASLVLMAIGPSCQNPGGVSVSIDVGLGVTPRSAASFRPANCLQASFGHVSRHQSLLVSILLDCIPGCTPAHGTHAPCQHIRNTC